LLIEKTGIATSRYFSVLADLGVSDAESRIPFDVLMLLAQLQFADQLESSVANDPF